MMITDWQPSHYRPDFYHHTSWSTCVRCQKKFRHDWDKIECSCKSCVYCSYDCERNDLDQHKKHCDRIKKLTREANEKVDALILGRTADEVHGMFNDEQRFPSRLSRESPKAYRKRIRSIENARSEYFVALESLMKELIREGWCRSKLGIRNDLAYKIAMSQSFKLLNPHNSQKLFQNHIYLITGRLRESYNLGCHFASKGRDLTREEVTPIHMSSDLPGYIKHHDYTQSYIKCASRTGKHFIYFEHEPEDCWPNYQAFLHMFLVKYLCHMEKDNLATIDRAFLNNPDCTNLIREFMGMEKMWMISPPNYFGDQAFEIMRLFHIEEKYFNYGGLANCCCDEFISAAKELYPDDMRKLVISALNSAKSWVASVRRVQLLSKAMDKSKWDDVIESYKEDHNLIYASCVRPYLPMLIHKVNEMAGSNVLGMNMDVTLGVSKFLTEADKACYNSHQKSFSHLYDEPCSDLAMNDRDKFRDFSPTGDDSGLPKDGYLFHRYYSIMMCVMIEVKLAQCYFHRNCRSVKAAEILDQIPDDSYELDPPNEDAFGKAGALGDFLEAHGRCLRDNHKSLILHASEWIPTVTKTVDALFYAGLGTEDNLSILFGRSDFVSYRLWTLKRGQLERSQPSILAFATRSRMWTEGCIDNDHKLGLRIKYLNKSDRRRRFEQMAKLGSMGKLVELLQPSLEKFASKFGWAHLGFQSEGFFRDCCSCHAVEVEDHQRSCDIGSKKCKRELDHFTTAAEACKHFFDATSLEEAIWDAVGIPRLIALNAYDPPHSWSRHHPSQPKDSMKKLGWKYCGSKVKLGDRSVRLGHRVVHVCSDWCTVWEEREAMEGSENIMEE